MMTDSINTKLNTDDKTIAVLPFVNMSTDSENEYFSDGITEEIINALAKINQLKVTSRTSSFFFKNKNIPIQEIAKELNVAAVLEGSVRLSGDTMRITAQLINTTEDYHYWSETWDRKRENIFEIQDEISIQIAEKLRENLGHFEIQEHLVSKQTESIAAYELTLKAKFYKNKWNPEDVKFAISLYEEALDLDANYPESYLGLADSYSFLGTTGFLPFEEAWAKTIEYTAKANALNDNLSGVHYQLANQAFFISCDYKEAVLQMAKAIEINPNNAEAQQFMSFLYILSGDVKNSRKHLDIAVRINPLSDETKFFVAYFHYMIGDYEKSLALLNKCILANDKNIPAYAVKSLTLLMLERYDEVIECFDKMPKEVVVIGEKIGAISLAWALKKDADKTFYYLGELEQLAADVNGFTADSFLYLMHVVLGNMNKAFDWVENAIENNSALLLLRYSDPVAKDLQTDPRYLEYHKIIFPKAKLLNQSGKKKEILDEQTKDAYSKRLLQHIEMNKPYLESDLSLRILASQIEIPPNQLSFVLNESIGKNFNEFINHYRVETFKEIAKDPKNAHITLIGLAYDSGFNSKTVFNTYFKKETGLTPKQFLKS